MKTGIVNVYKEKGFTSFDVVAKLRGVFHQKKIGHTGTLDPDAEGVLPVCLGKATKVCDLLTDKDKVYETVLLLGKETTTQDISGEVINECEVSVPKEKVIEAIESFIGSYQQIPPMYSALKVNGQKLCDLARNGITVPRKARNVEIYAIDILKIDLPEVTMRVHCSKGTYIRTLCDDIGKKLNIYGCMKSLVRTKVAHFTIDQAYRISQLEQLVLQPEESWEFLEPVDSVFEKYSAVYAVEEAEKFIRNGNRISVDLLNTDQVKTELVRLYNYNGEFIGIYNYLEDEKEYKPVKLFME